MHPPKPVFDAFLEWAKRSFQQEVIADFERAKSFDGYDSKLAVKALRAFPVENLRLFAHALPTSLWVSHPESANLIGQLSTSDKQATEGFQQAVQHLRQQEWREFSDHIARKRRPETLAEAQRVRAVGLAVVKEFAGKSGYNAEKIDPEVWRLSALKGWGRISADLSFESPLELSYAIFVHDPKGVPLRQGDHYLGVLGIAPSSWAITNAEECREKALRACDFVQWHLSEYVKLMDALGTDGVPPKGE
jgi:hypothetical protein